MEYGFIGNNINEFKEIGDLGKGHFGKVKKMQYLKNKQIYAVKILEKSQNEIYYVDRELKIMSNLNHKNIVKIYGFFQDNINYYLVNELVDGKSLQDFIEDKKKQNSGYIEQNLIISIFKQILIGLQYLHSLYIFHRDIKPDNILIDKNNNVKITDFGLAAFYIGGYQNLSSNYTRIGPIDYVAPEIYNRKRTYDYKCDIYSLGLTMYYLMNYHLPQNGINNNNNFYNRNLVYLVELMFKNDPNERPSADEALNYLLKIEREINTNNNNNNNNNSIDKIETSMIKAILYCFNGIDIINPIIEYIEINLRNKQIENDYFPLSFINILKAIKDKNKNVIEETKFNYDFESFRYKLSKKKYNIEVTSPISIYYNILLNFTKEFCLHLNWKNKLFEFYNKPSNFPESMFPNIYIGVEYFQNNYISPLIDIFDFLVLTLIKCIKCKMAINAYTQRLSFLPLYFENEINIMNLINRYFEEKFTQNNFICYNCNYCGKQIESKAFFSSPKYLMIDLEEKNKINYERMIDISQYLITNVGPKKYKLYAVINIEIINNSEVQYIAVINENKEWYFYSGDSRQKCGIETIKYGIPSCAIYKEI